MDHAVKLRAPTFLGGGAAPAIVRRTDQNFIEGLLRDLVSEEGRAHIRDNLLPAQGDDGTVLYLPVQRCFNVVLVEAYCDQPGDPRVDPAALELTGVVMRRRRAQRLGRRKTGAYHGAERWLSEHGRVLGWVPPVEANASRGSAPELEEDPEGARRPRPRSGREEIDRALAERRAMVAGNAPGVLDESFTELFAAPPAVCKTLGSTLLYGLVDVADPSVAEPPRLRLTANKVQRAGSGMPQHTEEEVRALMPIWLRVAASRPPVPAELAGRRFRAIDKGSGNSHQLAIQRLEGGAWVDFDANEPWRPNPGGDDTKLRSFVRMLWQARVELQLFSGHESANELLNTLAAVKVDLPDGSSTNVARLLEDASSVFVVLDEGKEVLFPNNWPEITHSVASGVVGGARASLSHQLSRFAAGEGRFDADGSRYELRVFTRVTREDGCPAELVWTDATPTFRVAKWYEGGPDAAVKPVIELPALDRGLFKALRPNVAVRVPRSMFNFLNNNDPANLLKGEAKNDTSGPAIAWICGFNISIIFIIAFMLLLTFVLLLNIAFWWMAFFRICIPLPAASGGED